MALVMEKEATAAAEGAVAAPRSFIFVDVDGVLNVGIRDHGRAPLLLNEENCDVAESIDDLGTLQADERECIEKVLAVTRRNVCKSEAEMYRKLACSSRLQCSGLLVTRLADIIRAGGDRCSVVLASNWRRPKYAKKVAKLEEALSVHLGRSFKFDAATAQGEEATASDRLGCIGAHLAGAMGEDGALAGLPVKVMVLDDFFITPLNGWMCQGERMTSKKDIETFLSGCCPQGTNVEVKMVHCYDEWTTASGLHVQVGSGLTAEDVRSSQHFLTGGAPPPAPPSAAKKLAMRRSKATPVTGPTASAGLPTMKCGKAATVMAGRETAFPPLVAA